jgi:hypothetical protein
MTYVEFVTPAPANAGLSHLGITPHSFRHGSASHAMQQGWLDSKSLMCRMRVLCPSTVRRYGKKGVLQHMVQKMGRRLRQSGEALGAADTAPGNPLWEVMARAASLSQRRLASRS